MLAVSLCYRILKETKIIITSKEMQMQKLLVLAHSLETLQSILLSEQAKHLELRQVFWKLVLARTSRVILRDQELPSGARRPLTRRQRMPIAAEVLLVNDTDPLSHMRDWLAVWPLHQAIVTDSMLFLKEMKKKDLPRRNSKPPLCRQHQRNRSVTLSSHRPYVIVKIKL